MSEESKIRDAADAVKGIVEAVPVYQDALQPAVREIGKGLETVAKSIRVYTTKRLTFHGRQCSIVILYDIYCLMLWKDTAKSAENPVESPVTTARFGSPNS